jgi:hypothetical protein
VHTYAVLHTFSEETLICLVIWSKIAYWLELCAFYKSAGPYYEWVGAGLTSVKISGMKNETIDLSSNNWVYKVLSSRSLIWHFNWEFSLEVHRIS